jgi:hypothetical protein
MVSSDRRVAELDPVFGGSRPLPSAVMAQEPLARIRLLASDLDSASRALHVH